MTDSHILDSDPRQNPAVTPSISGKRMPPVLTVAAIAALAVAAGCNFDMRGDAITRPYNIEVPQQETTAGPTALSVEPLTASPTPVQRTEVAPFQEQKFVVAKEGDTVRRIALQHRTDPDRLASFNSVFVDAPLDPGQIILFPADASPGSAPGIAELAENAIAEVESAETVGGQPAAIVSEAQNNPGRAEPSVASGGSSAVVTRTAALPDEEVPAPPSRNEPLPESPAQVELPDSPNLGQFRTASLDTTFTMPVAGEIINPYSGVGGNEGIDIAAPAGTSVVAAGHGEVALVSRNSDNTAILLIRHPEDIFTVYANITGVNLKSGDQVAKGQAIGVVASGEKEYLHFEVRIGTQSTDPIPYLS